METGNGRRNFNRSTCRQSYGFMTTYELTRVDAVSFGKLYAVISVVLTALFGWPVLFFEAAIPGSGIISYLFMLVFAGIFGFIGAAISALVYTLIAGAVGGVKFDADSFGAQPAERQTEPATMS